MASPLNRPGLRAAAASAALTLVALSANVPAAQAIPPPSVDPAMVPADARPGPDQPMRRSNSCSTPITVRNPDVAQLAPGFNLVNISKAWQYSTGNGVPVAVIDTGVSLNPRLPVVPGGDYIMGEDGLSDCDAHGTVVSSIIAAAPLGILPMPRAMPATAAFPPPAGPPQAAAAAANMCGPRPHLRGQRRCPLPAQLVTEIGPSGVLIGKLSNGDRLMIPVTDAGELSRVFVAADDTIAKRIVIRVVGAGERVCVHTRDQERWASVRMPQLSIVGTPRPAPRTTVGVVEYVRRRKNGDDGKSEGSGVDVAISPTPRPASVITIARPGTSLSESDRHGFEVTIEQIDRATVKVGAAGQNWLVEMEMFRAENRYVSLEPVTMSIGR
ncbi:hypothetical protein AAHH65_20520 [Mycobacterium tuberculosis]